MKRLALLMLLSAVAHATQAVAKETLYWTSGGVYKKSLPAGPVIQLYTYSKSVDAPMWVKRQDNAVYWGTYQSGQLWTSGPNGENAHVLIDLGWGYIRNIDFYAGKVYWAEEGYGKIYRADLDGQNVETVVSGHTGDNDGIVDFEIYNGRFYWTSWSSGRISTCALDGGDYRQINLAGGAGGGRAFAIEMQDDHMYIASNAAGSPQGGGALLAYTMDGTSYSVLATDRYIEGMDIFDADIFYSASNMGKIYRMPLDGGSETAVYDGPAWQLTVVPEPASAALFTMGLSILLARQRRRSPGSQR